MMNNTNSFNITKYKKKLGKDLVVFKVGHLLDVFFGKDGWEPHARFLVRKHQLGNNLTQIKGDKVPHHIYQQLLNEVQ